MKIIYKNQKLDYAGFKMEKYFCFYTKDNKALIYMTQTQINKAIKL
jgi:hypothetical protein